MKKVYASVVVKQEFDSKRMLDDLYEVIKNSKLNKWCAMTKDETFIKEVIQDNNTFFIYAWDENDKKINIDDEVINEIINEGAEGGYCIARHNDIKYDVMFSCTDEID